MTSQAVQKWVRQQWRLVRKHISSAFVKLDFIKLTWKRGKIIHSFYRKAEHYLSIYWANYHIYESHKSLYYSSLKLIRHFLTHCFISYLQWYYIANSAKSNRIVQHYHKILTIYQSSITTLWEPRPPLFPLQSSSALSTPFQHLDHTMQNCIPTKYGARNPLLLSGQYPLKSVHVIPQFVISLQPSSNMPHKSMYYI